MKQTQEQPEPPHSTGEGARPPRGIALMAKEIRFTVSDRVLLGLIGLLGTILTILGALFGIRGGQ
jgi:hypothetical protein